MLVDDLMEPLKVYNSRLKEEHYQNTVKYFDELVSKANIDINANRETIKKYKQELINLENVNKKISKYKGIRTFLIILMIVLTIAAVFTFIVGGLDLYISIICAVCAGILDIAFILIIVKVLNKKIKNSEAIKNEIISRLNSLKSEAWAQMAQLNIMYDWNIPATIINQSNSLIEMDKFFDAKKFQYLYEKFGLDENTEDNISSYFVQSGSILGNPFLICKDYRQEWFDKVYTGSITIHWTERQRTKDGWRTVHRSQVLTASITKPAPCYEYATYLVYGNDAAPKLSFSRNPSGINGMNDKQIAKKIKKDAKKLDKQAKDDLMDNDPTTNYVRFGNDEFETIFGGTDRDNEVEYRLLFTPLAQRNLIDLIKNARPYGDDFYLDKVKKLNYVQSVHSQNFDYKANPTMFIDYDYDIARKRFIDYNVKYFESFFFDIAPLISIPLYQQTKTSEYIYESEYRANITSYEHESLANAFNVNLLKHPETDTNVILKTKFINKEGLADKVKVTAHSFKAIPRTEIVTMRGGDGHLHGVPVVWYEYLPLEQDSYMAIEAKDSSRLDYINQSSTEQFKSILNGLGKAYLYERGLFAALLAKEITSADIQNINDVFKDNQIKEISAETLRNKINNAINSIEEKMEEIQAKTNANTSKVEESTNVQDSNISNSNEE